MTALLPKTFTRQGSDSLEATDDTTPSDMLNVLRKAGARDQPNRIRHLGNRVSSPEHILSLTLLVLSLILTTTEVGVAYPQIEMQTQPTYSIGSEHKSVWRIDKHPCIYLKTL